MHDDDGYGLLLQLLGFVWWVRPFAFTDGRPLNQINRSYALFNQSTGAAARPTQILRRKQARERGLSCPTPSAAAEQRAWHQGSSRPRQDEGGGWRGPRQWQPRQQCWPCWAVRRQAFCRRPLRCRRGSSRRRSSTAPPPPCSGRRPPRGRRGQQDWDDRGGGSSSNNRSGSRQASGCGRPRSIGRRRRASASGVAAGGRRTRWRRWPRSLRASTTGKGGLWIDRMGSL